jgi:predicted transcriptional regulator
MKQTTIELPDKTDEFLKQIAHQTGRTEAELIREAIEDYITRRMRPLHSCIGMGASGQSDLAQRDEELLWTEKWRL